jgi:hypothetical protein
MLWIPALFLVRLKTMCCSIASLKTGLYRRGPGIVFAFQSLCSFLKQVEVIVDEDDTADHRRDVFAVSREMRVVLIQALQYLQGERNGSDDPSGVGHSRCRVKKGYERERGFRGSEKAENAGSRPPVPIT